MRKRLLSLFLTICMIFAMLPVNALAVETPMEPASTGESASPSSVTDTSEMVRAAGDATTVTTKEELVLALGENGSGDVILGSDITDITTQLTVARDVTLDLNGYNLTIATSGSSSNSIKINGGVTLTIQDSSTSSTGTLTATHDATGTTPSRNCGAAINNTNARLVIESGTVKATAIGGYGAAGIGGGLWGDGGTVTINGGNVTATGSSNGAGIGGGHQSSGGDVTINGGTVVANGSTGIGGGSSGICNGGTVIITGGTVTAIGKETGAGIGGGSQGSGGTVEISGGIVKATGGSRAAGIGGGGSIYAGGNGGAGANVTISGGTVIASSIGGGRGDIYDGGADGSSGTLTITGGSIRSGGMAALSPDLRLLTLTVKELDGTLLTDTVLDATGHTIKSGGSDYPYGRKDLKTDEYGKLYFYLPVNVYEISVLAGGISYSNSNVNVKDSGGLADLRSSRGTPGQEQALRFAATDGGSYQLTADFDGQDGNEAILTTVLEIQNDFTLDLNGHKLTINTTNSNGIKIANGVTFTIKDSSVTNGALTVTAGGSGAGINTSGGTLIIESGTVTAKATSKGAGIGGGDYGSGGTVIINGGTVTASSTGLGAGIGGGYNGAGGNLTINGGTVKANGGQWSAGIGGSYKYDGGTVTINGGTVQARGGTYGAGIGGGGDSYNTGGAGGTVTINGGTVIAINGYQAPAIGGGMYGNPGTLTITGGSVNISNTTSSSSTPRGADGASQLYPTTLTLKGGSVVANAALASTGHNIVANNSRYPYGTKDVQTDAEGKLYFWLPAATYGIGLKVGSKSYSNNAVTVTASGGTADLTETTSTAPSNIILSGTSVAINAPSGTEIGTFTTVDMDGDESFTYTLVPGTGSSNNNLFTIVGDSLQLNSALPPETGPSLSIRVRTQDSGGEFFEKSFVITVINVPGKPTIQKVEPGNGQVTVSFAPPASNGGSEITNYTVTANPGGNTATGAVSPVTVTGLTNGTAYTFTVTATNSIGTGAPSDESASVTPKAPQTITFGNPGPQVFGTSPTLTATSDSGLPVTFTSAAPEVATITSDGKLTFLKAGTVTINADQAGNDEYFPADTVSQTFEVRAAVPGAPTIGMVTAGNRQVTVSFTPPDFTGGEEVEYIVTSNPGGITATGTASPITVAGLTNGTAYTFTVKARNSAGTGPDSQESQSVIPKAPQVITFDNPGPQNFGSSPTLNATSDSGLPVTFTSATPEVATITSDGKLTFLKTGTVTINADQAGNNEYLPAPTVSHTFEVRAVVPGAPMIGVVKAGNRQATVSFTPPAFTGGADITKYTVTANPGGITATGTGSPITVTGLTNGTTYTFTVTATNSAGTGPDSAESESITPVEGPVVVSVGVPANGSYGWDGTWTLRSTLTKKLTSQEHQESNFL